MSVKRIPVVVLHGALRSTVGLQPTARFLRARGLDARPFGYPTRRGGLIEHGRALDSFIRDWIGDRPPVIGFLTHSMGALVVRAYFEITGALGPAQRVVMLSPPNQGSRLARINARRRVFHWLYGDAATELVPERVAQLRPLPPSVALLVLAGGRGDPRGYNPLLPGDDDGVVAHSEMVLGDVQPQLVGGVHALLQWRPQVLERAATFLRGDSAPS